MRNYFILSLLLIALASSTRLLTLENPSFESQIRTYNNADLKKIALACEDYDRTKTGVQLLGGLHDYINSLSDDRIIEIIFSYVDKYTELKDCTKLEQLANIQKQDTSKMTLEERLNASSRSFLESVALGFEAYDRKQTGKQLMGGLHDYINSLSNTQIVAIIMKYVKTYPTFNSYEQLSTLSTGTVMTQDQLNTLLASYDRPTLVHLAIAVDEYDKSRSDVPRVGGLHDYAWKLGNDKLTEIIVNYTKKWPELLNKDLFNSLLQNQANSLHNIVGGFEDYAWRLDIEDLKSCALAAESYDRKERNVKLMGGLHDYIDSLNKDQVHKIVTDYVHKYPELRKPGVLEKLAKIPQGGFVAYLDTFDDDKLMKFCVALESYDRIVRNITIIGGIHDYVHTLTRSQLIDFILNKAKYYPEIRATGALEIINKKYNPEN